MKLISICSLTTIALMAAPVAAQGILPYLPKDTMMAVSAPDMSMSIAEFRQMPLAKMWAEDEVQTFFADVMEMAKGQIDEQLKMAKEMHEAGNLPIDPAELMKLRMNGGTFAITQMGLSQTERGPMPKMGSVMHMDFGQSAPTWNMLIAKSAPASDARRSRVASMRGEMPKKSAILWATISDVRRRSGSISKRLMVASCNSG